MKVDPKTEKFQGTLVIYNLITDENDPVTAFAIDWINAFAENAEQILVFSTHVGKYRLPTNVRVIEIGGGSFQKRFVGSLRLLKSFSKARKLTGEKIVFHHMSEKTACYLGLLYKVAGIRQGLWYSHNRKSWTLRCAVRFVDFIFSPTVNSFPINTSKIRPVGHGIKMARFAKLELINSPKTGILSLGRISRVKNLENIIDALSRTIPPRSKLTFVGPVMETEEYVQKLELRALNADVELEIKQPVAYADIPEAISHYSMCFSGSPNTVDKSVLEAAAVGCFVLSDNRHVLELTGMKEVWKSIGATLPTSIESQINQLKHYESEPNLRALLSKSCISRNEISTTSLRIMNDLVKK